MAKPKFFKQSHNLH